MSCYSCGAGFGFFSKEHGCKNCGFAFCGKCLTKKCEIPKLNNEKHKVCNKCYNILTGKINPEERKRDVSPPEAYKKRLAALQEKEKHGKDSHSKKTHLGSKGSSKHTSHSTPEREIEERLHKLKQKPPEQVAKENVSEKEIKERLARLKGENPDIQASQTKMTAHKPVEHKTQQLQIDDLLDEISNEMDLENRLPNNITELEGRLAGLKGERNTDQSASTNENDLNRGETKDTKPYVKNITDDNGKKSNEDGGEISAEEINKIMEETSEECELEARRALKNLEKDKNIMKRLQEIKGRQNEDVNKQGEGSGTDDPENQAENSDTDNEEQQASDIIKQIMEEDKLDEAAAKDGISVNSSNKPRKAPKPEQEEIEEDELPYCSICTEDATIRCHGCDLDLYCNRCWKESHVDFQMEDHVTSKYTKPKEWT